MKKNQKSKLYWANRKADFMVEQLDKSEAVSKELDKVYRLSSEYLKERSEKIFLKYQTDYGLSEAEARRYLSKLKTPHDITELKRLLASSDSEKAKEIVAQMDAPAYASRIKTLQETQAEIDTLMTSVAQTEYGMTTKVYKDIINSGYLSNMFDIQRQSGVVFSFNELDSGFVDKMLRINWAGRNYSDSIWNNTTGLADTLKTEFMVNYLTGRSDRDMARVLDERFGVGSFNARRLVRTESAFFENETEAISYEESDIERYEYLAILDERTSDMCARLDNKTFKVSERKPGINYPPLHAFCRSTTVAVFDDEWEEKIQDRVVSDVDSNRMTYDEWKNNPDIILKRKKNRNFTYDQEQYKRYKSAIGKGNVPKTFADFQEMKYNNGDKWKSIQDNYFVKSRLKDGRYGSVINPEKQAPHMKSTAKEGKSYFSDDVNVQNLFDKYAGTGNIERNRKGRTNKEIIYAPDFEGVVVNQGLESKTNYFKIHHSKKRLHIVPYEGRGN